MVFRSQHNGFFQLTVLRTQRFSNPLRFPFLGEHYKATNYILGRDSARERNQQKPLQTKIINLRQTSAVSPASQRKKKSHFLNAQIHSLHNAFRRLTLHSDGGTISGLC